MFRTLISYLVLILLPVVSLVIAVVPYVWAKRRSQRLSPMEQALLPEKEYRPANTIEHTSVYHVPLSRLWGAFFVGLVGNVGWWSLIFWITNDRISIYIGGTEGSGVLFGFFIYSFFIIITSFIFHGFRHGYLTVRSMIVNSIWFALITVIIIYSWPTLRLLGSSWLLVVFLLLTFLLPPMPFIVYGVGRKGLTAKATVYHLILTLLTAGLVLGVWIVLAIIGYRQLFYQLN